MDFDPRKWKNWPPPTCDRCMGASVTPVEHWRGQAVEGGTAWGLALRCNGCGTVWSARLLLSQYIRDGKMTWKVRGEGPFVTDVSRSPIRFAYLIDTEAAAAVIRWEAGREKSPEFVAAAVAAGFLELEVHESPVGVLEEDFVAGPGWVFHRGARALIGMNGSTLIEVADG